MCQKKWHAFISSCTTRSDSEMVKFLFGNDILSPIPSVQCWKECWVFDMLTKSGHVQNHEKMMVTFTTSTRCSMNDRVRSNIESGIWGFRESFVSPEGTRSPAILSPFNLNMPKRDTCYCYTVSFVSLMCAERQTAMFVHLEARNWLC